MGGIASGKGRGKAYGTERDSIKRCHKTATIYYSKKWFLMYNITDIYYILENYRINDKEESQICSFSCIFIIKSQI